ncbi:hypothetical protein AX16_007543 [Volvariella volvacea WC 439]|nr:hypothetical protein AX16_007543 [Volvariella volvacea WC 439]
MQTESVPAPVPDVVDGLAQLSIQPQPEQLQAQPSSPPPRQATPQPEDQRGAEAQPQAQNLFGERADRARSVAVASAAEVWWLKPIVFGEGENRKRYNIITQNFNGPCSFIAICNILILRGDIEILPPTRRSVSYEFLSQLVAEHLLRRSPGVDISSALSIMPLTQKGMDLNPVFTAATSFRPSSEVTGGGELQLFRQAGIELVHGWLVDPTSPEARALEVTPDYDSAVTLIVDADHITKGQLVVDESVEGHTTMEAGPSGATQEQQSLTDDERQKVETALIVRHFLETTQSQLTYHGLFTLSSMIGPNNLVALFRNSHLSVLYKRPAATDDESLYSLVTDSVFLNESSIVWERLEDIDGGWTTWVDSDFVKASPAGGDFAGQTAEEALRVAELAAGRIGNGDINDEALARQLQAEEDHYAWQRREAYLREQRKRELESSEKGEKKDKKKKSDCIIM